MFADIFTVLIIIAILLILAVGFGFSIYGIIIFIQKWRKDKLQQAELISTEITANEDGLMSDSTQPRNVNAHEGTEHTPPLLDDKKSPAKVPSTLPSITSDNLFFRCLFIAAITLLLLIPLAFIDSIIEERARLHKDTLRDISRDWGQSQVVNGPALIIPYDKWRITHTDTVTDKDGNTTVVPTRVASNMYFYVLPKNVSFTAMLSPQTRYRSIYKMVVYTAPINISGNFALPEEKEFGEDVTIHWDKAYLALGIADAKAITKIEPLSWDGSTAKAFNPGTNAGALLGLGFHAPVSIDQVKKDYQFQLSLNVNGSNGIHFTPVGETTNITISGNWPSPNFNGDLLPTSRTITDNDFTASWSIPHLSRTYAQTGDLLSSDGKRKDSNLTDFVAGVELFESISFYRLVTRAVKYGILFIGLTFIALLSIELATRERLHLIQYGLVGIAMSLFYLVLLSLAEHSSFLLAFIAASAVSVAMNSLYITVALKNKGKVLAALLAGLYALLYALLNMEEYALMVGTGMVVVVVGVLMYLTRSLPVSMIAGTQRKE